MIALSLAALAFAQAGALPPVEQDRLRVCLERARSDPPSAISAASVWLAEADGPETSLPQQCLGAAFTSLLRWAAAEAAFAAARDARPATDLASRARLGGMAGNAALAGENWQQALAHLDMAQVDARGAGMAMMGGDIAADRARALVALGQEAEAQDALEQARALAPQSSAVWLLSATLDRRMDQLVAAQAKIRTAAALAPEDPAIGLEAGLIAALAGNDGAARASWNSVIALAPDSPEAATARSWLRQLEPAPPIR